MNAPVHCGPEQPDADPWRALCGYPRGGVPVPVHRQICELAMAGQRPFEIARDLGLKKGTVASVLTRLRREQARDGD
ncbi:MAG: hypothetical protein WD009_02385 [Phycisphaeraceae bacterium]